MKNNVSMTKSSLVKKVLNEQVYLLSRLAWMEAISEMTKATACLTMSAADLRAARSELAQAVGALLTVDLAESAMELAHRLHLVSKARAGECLPLAGSTGGRGNQLVCG